MKTLLHRLEEGIIALILAAMTLITFAQVILRYVFGTGLIWGIEATQFLFAWLVLFGVSFGIRTGSHIAVDALTRLVSPPVQRAASLLSIVICAAYAAIMFSGGIYLLDAYALLAIDAEDIPLPMWLIVSIVPVGFGLIFLRLVETAWLVVAGKRSGISIPAHEMEMAPGAAEEEE